MWGLPLFDIKDPAAILFEINMCRKAKPNYYVKIAAFDNTRGVESCVLSFIRSASCLRAWFQTCTSRSCWL